MISASWHFDITRYKVDFMPVANIYLGLDDKNIIGFGYQYPIQIWHLTAAHYWKSGENDCWYVYSHLNQLFAIRCNNPFVEFGGTYVKTQSDMNESFSIGLSYGDGLSAGIIPTRLKNGEYCAFSRNGRLMPVLKIGVRGRDVSLSAVAYLGLWGKAYDNLVETISENNDTLMTIEHSEIDSIVYGVPYLKNGQKISFSHVFLHDLEVDLRSWRGLLWDATTAYWDRIESTDQHLIVDYDQIRKDYNEGRDIVITRFPRGLATDFRRPGGIFRDISLGFGIYDHNP